MCVVPHHAYVLRHPSQVTITRLSLRKPSPPMSILPVFIIIIPRVAVVSWMFVMYPCPFHSKPIKARYRKLKCICRLEVEEAVQKTRTVVVDNIKFELEA